MAQLKQSICKYLLGISFLLSWLAPLNSYAAIARPTSEIFRVSKDLAPSVSDDQHIDREYHGYYSQERAALHEKIVGDLLSQAASHTENPQMIFTSGPFGVGKSSLLQTLFARGVVQKEHYLVIDMDEVRKRLPEYEDLLRQDRASAVSLTQREVGYITEILLWRGIRARKSIILDSSLNDSKFFNWMIQEIKNSAPEYIGGFHLLRVIATPPTIEARIKDRNEHGGRLTVFNPKHYFDAERAYEGVRGNFDSIVIVENTDNIPRIVYFEQKTISGPIQIGTNFPLDKLRSGDLFSQLKQASNEPPTQPTYDIFIDLDWTLFYKIENPAEVEPKKLLTIDSSRGPTYYRASDHLAWFIRQLQSLKGLRIHFISGGDRERNIALLGKTFLDGGTPLSDPSVAANIFSKDSLTPLSDDISLPFYLQFAKFVQRLVPSLNMRRSLLVDDEPRFSKYGLKVVHSRGDYKFHQSFDPARIGQKYEAPSELAFYRERNKLVMLYHIIKEAYDADQLSPGVFAGYAERLSKGGDPDAWQPIESPEFSRFFGDHANKTVFCFSTLHSGQLPLNQ